MTLKILLLTLSVISPIPALVIGYKKRQTLLWIYLLVGFVFDVTLVILKRGYGINNAWAGNLFTLTEFIILSFLYKDYILKNKVLFYFIISSLSLFFIVHTFGHSVLKPNKEGAGILAFVYILYSIAGFYTILKEQKVIFLDKHWFFWFNTAFLIYASGILFLFLFRDYLKEKNADLFGILWNYLFLSLNIIKNSLLAFAIYHFRRNK
jgi:hypothetical protein